MSNLSVKTQTVLHGAMAVCPGVVAAVVFVDVVLRYVFGSAIAASEELSRLLFVWMVFIGATAAYPRGELMAFTMLLSALKSHPHLFALLTVLIRLLTILACVLLARGNRLPSGSTATLLYCVIRQRSCRYRLSCLHRPSASWR